MERQFEFKRFVTATLLVIVMVACTACGSSQESSDKNKKKKADKAAASITYTYVSPSGLKSDPSSDAGTGPGSGADTQSFDFSGSYSAVLSADGKEVSSDGKDIRTEESDQNAALAENGGTVSITKATISKSGSDNDGDNCNFYGLNSSVLAIGSKSKIYISDSSIGSDSKGSNGIFSTDNAGVYANKVSIKTTNGDNSRGLDATYGGVIFGNKLDISTEKEHCAALATDRGGGYISVTNSKLKTEGSGSPLIYSTGDIEVDNTTGTAGGSQIAGMEGKNRIVINNSKLTSTNDARSGSDPIKNGIILYQSTSGDADTATGEKAEFQAADSTLKTSISDGAMFYVTNTSARVVLENTKLDFNSGDVDLINAAGNNNNWGTAGSNGGNVTFTCRDMQVRGDVKVDDISSISLYLADGTTYTGRTKGSISSDNMNVNVSKDSAWIVTDSCTVSTLNVAKGGKVTDKDGKTVSVVKGDRTLVKGDSDITVTVTGSYGTKVKKNSDTVYNTDVLSRKAFDKYFNTKTSFGKNS